MQRDEFILYVDDDKDDMEAFAKALDEVRPSVRLCWAKNGEEGVKKLKLLGEQGCMRQFIILDINMPRINGKEVLQSLKALPFYAKTPVYILTTSDSPQEKAYFESYGVYMFTKPFSFVELK